MEINRYVFGTAIDGSYKQLFAADTLRRFLVEEKQAYDVRTTMEKCISPLFFKYVALADAQQYSKKERPLFMQYVPLHLRKVEGMNKKMLPFGAWGVCGPENSGNEGVWADESRTSGRETYYTQIEMFDLENIYDNTEYNHLDILFGMRAMTDLDVKQLRVGSDSMNVSSDIERVAPTMHQEDKAHVIAAVKALYDNKTVVIHLEKGGSFARRSRELLMQIYSMIPPMFAKEIGYASYCSPGSIRSLTESWSIRIFVVPGEEHLPEESFPSSQFKVLEMSRPEIEGQDSMWNALQTWWIIPWDDRIEIMRRQFADTESTFHLQDAFQKISQQYFRKLQDFRVWRRTASFQDMNTLEDFRKEYNKYSFWDDVPGAKVQFASRVRRALEAKGLSLKELTAAAFVESQRETDAEKRVLLNRQYVFGDRLSKLTPKDVYAAVEGYIDLDVQRKSKEILAEKDRIIRTKDAELGQAEEEKRKALEAQQEKYEADIAGLKAEHKSELAAKDELLQKKKAELSKKDQEKQEALDTQKEQYEADIAGLKAEHKSELDEKDDLLQQKVAELSEKDREKQEALDTQKGQYEKTIADMEKKHQSELSAKETLLEKKDGELSTKDKEKQQALDDQKKQYETEISTLKTTHQTALDEKDTEIKGKAEMLEEKDNTIESTKKALQEEEKKVNRLNNMLAVYQDGKTGLSALLALVFPPKHSQRVLLGAQEPRISVEDAETISKGFHLRGRKVSMKTFWQRNSLSILALLVVFLLGIGAGALLFGRGAHPDDGNPAPIGSSTTDGTTTPPETPAISESTTPIDPPSTTEPASEPVDPAQQDTKWLTEDIAEALRNHEAVATFMLPEDFPEEQNLNALALISDKQIESNGMPKCYLLALEEIPEDKSDLYAYFTYENICLAVYQSYCTDHSTELAIKLMTQIIDMGPGYHHDVKVYVRLDKSIKEKEPVAIQEPFRQELGTDQWLWQVTDWITGSDTDGYMSDACVEDRLAFVAKGEKWSMFFANSDKLQDDPAELKKAREEKFRNNSADWGEFAFLFDDKES